MDEKEHMSQRRAEERSEVACLCATAVLVAYSQQLEWGQGLLPSRPRHPCIHVEHSGQRDVRQKRLLCTIARETRFAFGLTGSCHAHGSYHDYTVALV
jgi:hypothetical protein